jgi:hypothetical protein
VVRAAPSTLLARGPRCWPAYALGEIVFLSHLPSSLPSAELFPATGNTAQSPRPRGTRQGCQYFRPA